MIHMEQLVHTVHIVHIVHMVQICNALVKDGTGDIQCFYCLIQFQNNSTKLFTIEEDDFYINVLFIDIVGFVEGICSS